MKAIRALLCRVFTPQKRPDKGMKILLFAAGIYVLLLIWVILFKFSFISQININSPMSLWERFLNGFHFFYFIFEENAWRFIKGLLVAILNILLFCPFGIYASFFYNAKRSITFAAIFSLAVECTQLFVKFGVFSFEDILLNTLGAVIGCFLYHKCVNRISDNATQQVNRWTVRIGAPFAALAYSNVIVAMVLYFS